MDFYLKHNLDYTKFKVVLSCWRGETNWRFLQEGYPALIKPKNKSKTQLQIFHQEKIEKGIILVDSGSKNLKIRIDEYETDWLEKGNYY